MVLRAWCNQSSEANSPAIYLGLCLQCSVPCDLICKVQHLPTSNQAGAALHWVDQISEYNAGLSSVVGRGAGVFLLGGFLTQVWVGLGPGQFLGLWVLAVTLSRSLISALSNQPQ